jgi:hypothetical protein
MLWLLHAGDTRLWFWTYRLGYDDNDQVLWFCFFSLANFTILSSSSFQLVQHATTSECMIMWHEKHNKSVSFFISFFRSYIKANSFSFCFFTPG